MVSKIEKVLQLLSSPTNYDRWKHRSQKMQSSLYLIQSIRLSSKIWVLKKLNHPSKAHEARLDDLKRIHVPYLNGFRHLFNGIVELLHYGDYENALLFTRKAIAATDHFGQSAAKASAYSLLASITYKQGNPSQAWDYALKALQLMWEGRNHIGIARVTFNLAQILYSQSEFNDAAILFQRSIKLYEEANDIPNQIQGLSELSAAYLAMGLYPKARSILEFLLTQERRLGAQEMIFITYDYADLSIMTGDFDQARKMLRRCRKLSHNLGVKPMEAAALALHGKLEEFSGDKEEAISLFKESIEIQESIQNREILLDSYCDLGHLYLISKSYQDARASLDSARLVAERDGHVKLITQCDLYDIEYDIQLRKLDNLFPRIQELLKKVIEYDDPTMLNISRLNLIEYYVLQNKLDSALEEVEIVIQSAKEENAKITQLQGLIVKAAIKTKNGKYNESLEIIEQCLRETEERGLSPITQDALNLKQNILLFQETGDVYDQVEKLREKQHPKKGLSTEDVAEYISRAKSVVASMES